MWLNSIFGFCWIWGARLLACRSCLLGWAICTLVVWSRLFLYLQASFVAVNQMDGKILSPTAPIPVSYEDAPNTTQYNVLVMWRGVTLAELWHVCPEVLRPLSRRMWTSPVTLIAVNLRVQFFLGPGLTASKPSEAQQRRNFKMFVASMQ